MSGKRQTSHQELSEDPVGGSEERGNARVTNVSRPRTQRVGKPWLHQPRRSSFAVARGGSYQRGLFAPHFHGRWQVD
jgi:hypothetical protein